MLSTCSIAHCLLLQGQFLVLSRDVGLMDAWLIENISRGSVMTSKHRGDLTLCLSDWCDSNL